MEKYEIQKLRDLPIEGVAERLGLQVVRHKSLCPFHDDHHASLSFSVRRNSYRCFVCGASGGTIDLVMRHLNLGFREACQWLADENCIILETYQPQTSSITHQTSFDASRYERYFERPWLSAEARRFLFDERRLDPRVVRWCRLTSWTDRQGIPWLQIPYYSQDGRLVGVQNRNLVRGGSPRFRFPAGSQCGIYNLPVLNRLKPGDELWITEGASDCWAMLSAGHKAIAIPSATLLTKRDVELLSMFRSAEGRLLPSGRKNVPLGQRPLATNGTQECSITFHMYPDRDEPGERLFLQLQKVLPDLVHHQLPSGYKDFGEYYQETGVRRQ
jgi:DNA primase